MNAASSELTTPAAPSGAQGLAEIEEVSADDDQSDPRKLEPLERVFSFFGSGAS